MASNENTVKSSLTDVTSAKLEKPKKEKYKAHKISTWELIKGYRSIQDKKERKNAAYVIRRRLVDKVWPFFRFLILFGLAFIIMYPMIYMVSTAFRPQSEMSDPSILWIPKTFTFSNLIDSFNAMNYMTTLGKTLSLNIVSSLLQVVTCALTGYGFARFKFPFRNLLFGIVILQIIVPPQILLIPQFMQFRFFGPGGSINLIGSPLALYLPAFFVNGIRAGLFVLIFRQFFRGLPKELEDAAYLDGCGPFKTFIRIMVPNASSSFLTVFLFSIVWYWNDSYVSGMFYPSKDATIALMVSNLSFMINQYLFPGETRSTLDFVVWMEAGCLLSIIPVLVMYVFLQKYFTEGIERSGLVG